MRISDWSSDVCSSDLIAEFQKGLFFRSQIGKRAGFELCKDVRQQRRHCIVKGLYLSNVGRQPLGQPSGLSRQHQPAQETFEALVFSRTKAVSHSETPVRHEGVAAISLSRRSGDNSIGGASGRERGGQW